MYNRVWAKLSVLQLKTELRKRKLSDNGNKIQLIERLEQDDKQKEKESTVKKSEGAVDYEKYTIIQLKTELKKRKLSDFGNRIMMMRKLQEDDKKKTELTKTEKNCKAESKSGNAGQQAVIKTESTKKEIVTDTGIKKEVVPDDVEEAEMNLGKAVFDEPVLLPGMYNTGYNIMHSLKIVVIKNVPVQQADKPFLSRWLKKAKYSRVQIKEKGKCDIVLKFKSVNLGNQAYRSIKKGVDDGIVLVKHPNFEYWGAHPCEYWKELSSLCELSDGPLFEEEIENPNKNRDDQKRTCVIEKLPVDVTEEDLIGTFEEVRDIHVFSYDPSSAGIALLEFDSIEKAKTFAVKNKTVTFKKKAYPLSLYSEKLLAWNKKADKVFSEVNERKILSNVVRVSFLKKHNEIHEEKKQLLDREDMTGEEILVQFAKLQERDRPLKMAVINDTRRRNYNKMAFPEPENLTLHKTYPSATGMKAKKKKMLEKASGDSQPKKAAASVTKPNESNVPTSKQPQKQQNNYPQNKVNKYQQNKQQSSKIQPLMNKPRISSDISNSKRVASQSNFGPAQKFQKFNDKGKVTGLFDVQRPVASGFLAGDSSHKPLKKSILGEPPGSLLGPAPIQTPSILGPAQRESHSILRTQGILQSTPAVESFYQPRMQERRVNLLSEDNKFNRNDTDMYKKTVEDNRFNRSSTDMFKREDNRFNRSSTDMFRKAEDNRFDRNSTDMFRREEVNSFNRSGVTDMFRKTGEDNRFNRSGTNIFSTEDNRFNRSGTNIFNTEDNRFNGSSTDMFRNAEEDNRFNRSSTDMFRKAEEGNTFNRSGTDMFRKVDENNTFTRGSTDLFRKADGTNTFSRSSTNDFRKTDAGGFQRDIRKTQFSGTGLQEMVDPYRSVTGKFHDTEGDSKRLSDGTFSDFRTSNFRDSNQGSFRNAAGASDIYDEFHGRQAMVGDGLTRNPIQQRSQFDGMASERVQHLNSSGARSENMPATTVNQFSSVLGERAKGLIGTNLPSKLHKPGYGEHNFDKRPLSTSGIFEGRTQVWQNKEGQFLGDSAITTRSTAEAWKQTAQPPSLMDFNVGNRQQTSETQSWKSIPSTSSFGTREAAPVPMRAGSLQKPVVAQIDYNHRTNPFEGKNQTSGTARFYESASRSEVTSAPAAYGRDNVAFTSVQQSGFGQELDRFRRNEKSIDPFQRVDLDYDKRRGNLPVTSRDVGSDYQWNTGTTGFNNTNFEMKTAAFRAGRL